MKRYRTKPGSDPSVVVDAQQATEAMFTAGGPDIVHSSVFTDSKYGGRYARKGQWFVLWPGRFLEVMTDELFRETFDPVEDGRSGSVTKDVVVDPVWFGTRAAFPLIDHMGDGWPGIDVRTYIAANVASGIMATESTHGFLDAKMVGRRSVEIAEAVIAELSNGRVP